MEKVNRSGVGEGYHYYFPFPTPSQIHHSCLNLLISTGSSPKFNVQVIVTSVPSCGTVMKTAGHPGGRVPVSKLIFLLASCDVLASYLPRVPHG